MSRDNVVYGPFWPLREEPSPAIEDVEALDVNELVAQQTAILEAELSADPALVDEIARIDRQLGEGNAVARLIRAGAEVMIRENARAVNAPAADGKSTAGGLPAEPGGFPHKETRKVDRLAVRRASRS